VPTAEAVAAAESDLPCLTDRSKPVLRKRSIQVLIMTPHGPIVRDNDVERDK